MRIVLVLRGKMVGMPGWVTDVVDVRGGKVWVGERGEYEEKIKEEGRSISAGVDMGGKGAEKRDVSTSRKDPVVKVSEVTVAYGPKTVSQHHTAFCQRKPLL